MANARPQVDGQDVPYELAYSQWLTDWVLKLTEDGKCVVSGVPSRSVLTHSVLLLVLLCLAPRQAPSERRAADCGAGAARAALDICA